MTPFDRYPSRGQEPLGKCGGANCRHEYGLTPQRLTGQTACAYCGLCLVGTYEHWLLMSVDHVIPTKAGIALGVNREYLDDYCNTVLCCSACNGFGNRYKLDESEVIPPDFASFVKLRDRTFTARTALILDCQRREREFFDSRPWEQQSGGAV